MLHILSHRKFYDLKFGEQIETPARSHVSSRATARTHLSYPLPTLPRAYENGTLAVYLYPCNHGQQRPVSVTVARSCEPSTSSPRSVSPRLSEAPVSPFFLVWTTDLATTEVETSGRQLFVMIFKITGSKVEKRISNYLPKHPLRIIKYINILKHSTSANQHNLNIYEQIYTENNLEIGWVNILI